MPEKLDPITQAQNDEISAQVEATQAQRKADNARRMRRATEIANGVATTPYCTPETAGIHKMTWQGAEKGYLCECGQRYAKGPKGTLVAIPSGGALVTVSVAAATAVLGYNLLQNRPDVAVSGNDRLISKMGLTGSAAAGDTAVDLFIAGTRVMTHYNTNTGFPQRLADLIDIGPYFVAAGDPVAAIITDAAATNPINFQIDIN